MSQTYEPIPYEAADKLLAKLHARVALVSAAMSLLRIWDASTKDGKMSPTQRSRLLHAAVEHLRACVRGCV